VPSTVGLEIYVERHVDVRRNETILRIASYGIEFCDVIGLIAIDRWIEAFNETHTRTATKGF